MCFLVGTRVIGRVHFTPVGASLNNGVRPRLIVVKERECVWWKSGPGLREMGIWSLVGDGLGFVLIRGRRGGAVRTAKSLEAVRVRDGL